MSLLFSFAIGKLHSWLWRSLLEHNPWSMLCSVLPAAIQYAFVTRCCTSEHSLGATTPCLEELAQSLLAEGIKALDDLALLGRRCIHWSLYQFRLFCEWLRMSGSCLRRISTTSSTVDLDLWRWATRGIYVLQCKREARDVVHFFLKLYFFVSISWKRQVKRLKGIVFVHDSSRKDIGYDCMSFDSWNNTCVQRFLPRILWPYGFTRSTVGVSSKTDLASASDIIWSYLQSLVIKHHFPLSIGANVIKLHV